MSFAYDGKLLFSIIVPVYNAEKYLAACIDSILEQTYSNFELILVNDGSADNSREICDEYSKKDNRIRVIHFDRNLGVVSARDAGIREARGMYIAWVDSDDWIGKDRLFSFYEEIKRCEPDIILTGYTLVGKKGQKHVIHDSYKPAAYFGENFTYIKKTMLSFDKRKNSRHISGSLCTKVWKRDLLTVTVGHLPKALFMGDDAPRTYIGFMMASSLVVIDDSSYFYRVNDNQGTGAYHKSYFENAIWIYNFISEQQKLNGWSDISEGIAENICHVSAFSLLNETRSVMTKKELKSFIKNIISDNRVSSSITDGAIKNQNAYYKLLLKNMQKKKINTLYYLIKPYGWYYKLANLGF